MNLVHLVLPFEPWEHSLRYPYLRPLQSPVSVGGAPTVSSVVSRDTETTVERYPGTRSVKGRDSESKE